FGSVTYTQCPVGAPAGVASAEGGGVREAGGRAGERDGAGARTPGGGNGGSARATVAKLANALATSSDPTRGRTGGVISRSRRCVSGHSQLDGDIHRLRPVH